MQIAAHEFAPTAQTDVGALDAKRRQMLFETLWSLYVILYGLVAGGGVVVAVVVAVTWVTLRDAVRVSG